MESKSFSVLSINVIIRMGFTVSSGSEHDLGRRKVSQVKTNRSVCGRHASEFSNLLWKTREDQDLLDMLQEAEDKAAPLTVHWPLSSVDVVVTLSGICIGRTLSQRHRQHGGNGSGPFPRSRPHSAAHRNIV